MNASEPAVLDRFATMLPGDLASTSINAAELYFGAHRSGRPERNIERVGTFLAPFALLVFDIAAAEQHGKLRYHLAATGSLIGAHDMLIAAIALANDAILVTHNTDEFGRVPGLRLEDWTLPV